MAPALDSGEGKQVDGDLQLRHTSLGYSCEWALVFPVCYDEAKEAAWKLQTAPEQIEYIDRLIRDALTPRRGPEGETRTNHIFKKHLDLKVFETWLDFRIAVLNCLLEVLVLSAEERFPNLTCELFRSVGQDPSTGATNVVLLLHLPESAARVHAQHQLYHLQLQDDVPSRMGLPEVVRLAPGFLPFEQALIQHYEDVKSTVLFRPPRNISNQYDEPQSIADHLVRERRFFSTVDTVRLISEAVAQHVDVHTLVNSGILAAQFPLHSSDELASLARSWANPLHIITWSQPIENIRAYFGEQVAFYFSWLGFQAQVLTVLAFCGLILEAFIINNILDDVATTATYSAASITVVMWSHVYVALWRNIEHSLRIAWVPSAQHVTRRTNPKYRGQWVPDPVTGEWQRRYPASKRHLAQGTSNFITLLFVGLSISVIVGLFSLHDYLLDQDWQFADVSYMVLNMLQIVVLDRIWSRVAPWLVDLENHLDFEKKRNALIWKLFLFQAINQFGASMWIAFMRTEENCDGSCVDELRYQLATVFGAKYGLTIWSDVLVPWATYRWQIFQEDGMKLSSSRQRSFVEKQVMLISYDWHASIEDYTQVILQFGLVLVFFPVVPGLAVLALFSHLLQIRADAWKFCCTYRRPFPEEVSGIGAWNGVMECLRTLAIVVNAALVFFTTDFFRERSSEWRWLMLLVSYHAGKISGEFVFLLLPTESWSARISAKRHELVKDKLDDERIICHGCSTGSHQTNVPLPCPREPAVSAVTPQFTMSSDLRLLSDLRLAPHLRSNHMPTLCELLQESCLCGATAPRSSRTRSAAFRAGAVFPIMPTMDATYRSHPDGSPKYGSPKSMGQLSMMR